MPRRPAPTFFTSPERFRAWLERHHAGEAELQVGFHKVATGKPSLTWSQSVDEALCFGWIDGVRRSLGPEAYTIRFTPRRPGSTWSAVNVAKVEQLEREGRMHPAGREVYARRTDARTQVYTYERRGEARLTAAQQRTFRARPEAWAFFGAQPPGYRRTAIYWVAAAKQEATRDRRLAVLVADSAAGRRLGQLGGRPPGPGRRGHGKAGGERSGGGKVSGPRIGAGRRRAGPGAR
jgi:uncharacterized protein YdeI (YjbR/CyaY-like superfamily)